MDKARRDHLRDVVGRARGKVEASLGASLAGYGLFTDREPLTRAELTALLPADEAQYTRVLEAVRRHGRAVGQGAAIGSRAVARFVREAGGTWVNRLAALRALEARGLLDPWAAFVSDDYGGLSPRAARLRQRAAERSERLAPDEALKAGIEDACRELSSGVRVLFDLSDEQGLVWPDGTTLRDVLRLFSSDVSRDDWSEPDVLGWVYQYYNTEANAELKRLKNRTTGFKYRPDDIPIANQFYTPHWVVRVLTDNTLGRLWLEMQDRLPRLERAEEASGEAAGTAYRLVERRQDVPHARDDAEGFKAWILEEPDPRRDGTVDRLCRFLVPLPSPPPPRPPKSVREIRVLDPACGSGHFLLYAFDLLFAMYREAEPELDPRLIPALILEHNLFGIDIDLRAAQLAAFGLYLKARTTLAAIDPKAPLDLRGVNIVVADAHINDDPRKAQFLERFRDDPEIQELYRRVLHDLDHTNALGSLLKVRTEFETLFGRIRQTRDRARPAASSFDLNQGVLIEASPQLGLRETYRAHSGRTWTIRELLDELRQFEAEVVPGQDIGARLFYTDVERTVGLLGLLSEQYDVVLMNPPYGDMPAETKDYLKGNRARGITAHYPKTHGDLFAAFIEQALDLAMSNGLVGGLVPWTYMYLSTMESVRKHILCGGSRPELLQEYGYNILDGATVGTVATVARKSPPLEASVLQHAPVFDRLSEQKRDWQKYEKFLKTFPVFVAAGPSPETDWFVARLGSLQDIPTMPYAYWASDSLRALFSTYPALDCDQANVIGPGRPATKIADVKQGLATADDARFVRSWWEVDARAFGHGKQWVPFVKGGTSISFYSRIDLVVNWNADGAELKEWASHISKGHWSKRIYSVSYYFRPGVTWPPASWRIRRFGTFAEGHIFGHKGCSIFPVIGSAFSIAGLLNSSLGTVAMLMQTPERMWEVGMVGAVPIAPTALASPRVAELATALVGHRQAAHAGDETCRDFHAPDLLGLWTARRDTADTQLDLPALLATWLEARHHAADEETRLVRELDREVYRLYEISEQDQLLIDRELARRPRAEGGYVAGEGPESPTTDEVAASVDASMDREDDEEDADARESEPALDEVPDVIARGRARGLVSRWLSHYLKWTLEADEDGIAPVDPMHGQPALVLRLTETMQRDLGRDTAVALEQQAPAYLGTRDVAEWLATSREETVREGTTTERLPVGFFPWYVMLYRNRPIFWLLSSENFEHGKTQLTFRVYLHYLKLTSDTLPRVLTHYLDPTIDRADRETQLAREAAARAEGRARTSAQRTATEWVNTLAALRGFRKAVEEVIEGPLHAAQPPANAKWLPRTIAEVRGGRDRGHGYRPDIDFGVRVNVTPLAEKKLLPRVALKRLGG